MVKVIHVVSMVVAAVTIAADNGMAGVGTPAIIFI